MNTFLDPVEFSLASKGIRFADFLIDSIMYYLLNSFLITPFLSYFMISTNGLGGIISNMENLWLIYVFDFFMSFIVYSMYFTLQEYFFNGRTLGKFITGSKVVMLTGESPTFFNYFIRSLSRCVPFEAFSFFGETGWHDAWSKTRVVNVKEFEQNSAKFNSIDQIGKPEII